VDTRSILGVQPLRPTFLDDVPAAESRETQARHGDHLVTNLDSCCDYVLDDDDEIEDDEDEDDFEDEDDEDEDEEDDEEPETWQVSPNGRLT